MSGRRPRQPSSTPFRFGRCYQPSASPLPGTRPSRSASTLGPRYFLRPEPSPGPSWSTFNSAFTLAVPQGTSDRVVDAAAAREAQRAKELAGQRHLLRLWRLPGGSRALGLWRARDPAQMQAILKSLPLDGWTTVQTTPLTPHPSDPGLAAS